MAGFHGFSILSENVLEVIENRDVIKMLKFMWARFDMRYIQTLYGYLVKHY